MTHQEIIIAGFGGQGILSAGRIIAYAGMIENKHVSWFPSYGAEMRGGTANCHVIVSDEKIGSPVINASSSLIVMNEPSLDKFEDMVVKGGLIITDSSLVEKAPSREDVEVFRIPAAKTASSMGNATFATIILLGRLLVRTNIVPKESFIEALKKTLPEKKHYLIPEEIKALEFGMEY